MNRLGRFRSSVLSGYAVLGANVLYSLASVPLALHHLDAPHFGLWATAMQLAGYLQLIDLGMSGALARILIDYKDDPAGGAYGSVLRTGLLVLCLQAALIVVGGCAGAWALAFALQLPAELVPTFVGLFCWLSCSTALSFVTKLPAQLLVAHQRNDLVNYSHIGLFLVSLLVLWLGFRAGFGVYSLALASTAGVIFSAAATFAACRQLRLFPGTGAWGRVDFQRLRELFAFGKDLFLVAVGTQLIMASQTVLITRVIGLEAAAVWSVCTRVYNMIHLFVWRPFDMSLPALSEMTARGESGPLQHRFRTLTIVTLSLAVVAGLLLALLNQSFVQVWTDGRIQWPAGNDVLLAVQLAILALVHCHCSLPLVRKRIGVMPYVYFAEGLLALVLGYFSTRAWGMTGLLLSSTFCTLLCSAPYGLWRTKHLFALGWAEVLGGWAAPALRVLVLAAPVAFFTWLATQSWSPTARLVLGACALGPYLGWIFVRFGLEPALRAELVHHTPAGWRRAAQTLLEVP